MVLGKLVSRFYKTSLDITNFEIDELFEKIPPNASIFSRSYCTWYDSGYNKKNEANPTLSSFLTLIRVFEPGNCKTKNPLSDTKGKTIVVTRIPSHDEDKSKEVSEEFAKYILSALTTSNRNYLTHILEIQ